MSAYIYERYRIIPIGKTTRKLIGNTDCGPFILGGGFLRDEIKVNPTLAGADVIIYRRNFGPIETRYLTADQPDTSVTVRGIFIKRNISVESFPNPPTPQPPLTF